jgi:hypothetical protein
MQYITYGEKNQRREKEKVEKKRRTINMYRDKIIITFKLPRILRIKTKIGNDVRVAR